MKDKYPAHAKLQLSLKKLHNMDKASNYLANSIKGLLKFSVYLYPNSSLEHEKFEDIGEFFRDELPKMWLKLLKFDMFFEKYQEWKEKVDDDKKELAQLEEVFKSFGGGLLED